MDEDLDIPPFELPEWGEEGAPPPPRLDDEAEAVPSAPTGPILATTAPSGGLGLVTAAGEAPLDEGGLAAAVASATDLAIEALHRRAAEAGAQAVEGVRLATVAADGKVAVVAYGTAVDR